MPWSFQGLTGEALERLSPNFKLPCEFEPSDHFAKVRFMPFKLLPVKEIAVNVNGSYMASNIRTTSRQYLDLDRFMGNGNAATAQ